MDIEDFKHAKADASQTAPDLPQTKDEAREYAEWWIRRTGGRVPSNSYGPAEQSSAIVCKESVKPGKAVHQSIYKGYIVFHSDWTGHWWVGDPNNAGQRLNPPEAVISEVSAKRFIDNMIAQQARQHQRDFIAHPFD